MKNYFDIKIQMYRSARQSKTPIGWKTLGDFLLSPMPELVNRIEEVRLAALYGDDELKRDLKANIPCACISAIVSGERTTDNVTEHTGLMCIDIDGKDNPAFPDMEVVKNLISGIREVLYCGLSVSGEGCFAIIPIQHKNNHEGHFKALRRILSERLGIYLDESCKDVTRLRFASYDESPYVNEHPEVFKVVDEVKAAMVEGMPTSPNGAGYECSNVLGKVEGLVSRLEDKGIDLCRYRNEEDGITDYNTWLKMAFAFADLGEDGRELFLRVCRLYGGHDEMKSIRKFNEALNTGRSSHGGKGVTIASFIKYAEEALEA